MLFMTGSYVYRITKLLWALNWLAVGRLCWCCKQVCATILQIQVDRLVIFNVSEELLNITSHVQILERLCHISTHHHVVVLEFSIEIIVINFVILIIILFSVLVKRSGLKYTSFSVDHLKKTGGDNDKINDNSSRLQLNTRI